LRVNHRRAFCDLSPDRSVRAAPSEASTCPWSVDSRRRLDSFRPVSVLRHMDEILRVRQTFFYQHAGKQNFAGNPTDASTSLAVFIANICLNK
jgi:hypothetical protein